MLVKTTLNLQPWRQLQQRRQTLRFIGLMLAAALLGCAPSLLSWYNLANSRTRLVEEQLELSQTTAALQLQLQQLGVQHQQLEQLSGQLEQLEALSAQRWVNQQLLVSLQAGLNPGVYLNSIQRQGLQVAVQGQARPAHRVSDLLLSLEKSGSYQAVVLDKLMLDEVSGWASFVLHLHLQTKHYVR